MVFNVLVGNLRMCSIPTGKHVRAQGLFSVRVSSVLRLRMESSLSIASRLGCGRLTATSVCTSITVVKVGLSAWMYPVADSRVMVRVVEAHARSGAIIPWLFTVHSTVADVPSISTWVASTTDR